MSTLIGGGLGPIVLGGLKTGIYSALPILSTIFTYIILFVTYPATPFIFILSYQLKQLKAMFYAERQL